MNGTMRNNNSSASGEVTVLMGAQWGDEGKGKVLDFLIGHKKVDVVARCQGGNNAGHTVVANGREYDFHLLPSGMASPNVLNVIGHGVVVNLDALFAELDHNGFVDNSLDPATRWEHRLFISEGAHLVLPVHIAVDGIQEGLLGERSKLGTTKRGIGPTYASKAFRDGVRLCDLMRDPEHFEQKYHALIAHYKRTFPDLQLDIDADLARLKAHAERLKKLGKVVCNTIMLLNRMRLVEGKSILVEGANGALLDIDTGTYPCVTSSNSNAGGACTGLGIPLRAFRHVIGIVKAYQTRVGSGPFPTELRDAEGERLQQIGAEFGVTTGRKRRCGWLDLVLLRYANVINGFTSLAVTKVDVLDQFKEIKVAVGYELDGEMKEHPPSCVSDWERLRVHYKRFDGWLADTTHARAWAELPPACQAYLEFVERELGVPIEYIGVGKAREALIVRERAQWQN